ncbi:MAG: COX15/CtaA family protein [Ignavibacteriales bacterium]|nr:COX15/CtaA family protein [Ignavibacteriales bacterium]
MTSYKNLHRFILITAICTFLLIIAGGLVTSTQSGLSVPDWPNTYGHFMFAFPLDQMAGGILYEHSHRMIASFVGFLTVIMAIWLWKREDSRWVRYLGVAALGAVVAQGVLGGLTVLFLLPTAISVSHATLAQTFFSIIVSLALITSRWWHTEQPLLRPSTKGISLIQLSLMTTIVVYIQLVFGALMRHTQSGLAVPDFPLAYGQLFPSLAPNAVAQYNQQLIHSDLRLVADDPITSTQILIHMLHRLWAVVVSGMVIWTSVRLLKLSSMSKRISRFAYLLLATIIVQLTLGAMTVLSLKAVDITTAHVATGAFLLASCVLVSLHAIKLYGFKKRKAVVSFSAQEVTV